MRLCFLLPSLKPSGGVAVALRYARGLAQRHGAEADVVVVGPVGGGTAELPVRTLAEVAERTYDVAIGTWWQTAADLWMIRAERRVVLLQSFEQRFYPPTAPFERLMAEVALALPLGFVAVAPWLGTMLTELRPAARARVVRPGIDKATFSARREVRRQGPLRVLVEGQPTLPFKGVSDAMAAVRAMREPVHATLVALDPETAAGLPVDRVVGGLDAREMAELYADSDVLLKLSRVEGLGLAPVEGFHCGLPCVVTPYTGHEDYAHHLDNAIVTGFDDPAGTAAWLDLLARDRELLSRLSAGALETAEAWPSEEAATALLHEALLELRDAAPPELDTRLLLRTLALGTELGRGRLARLEATEAALEAAQAHVRELSESRDDCARMLDEARAELLRIRSSRAYRAGSFLKRTGRRLGRG